VRHPRGERFETATLTTTIGTEEIEMRAYSEVEASEDPELVRRDKKGRALAAMGNVARTDDGFEVTTTGRRKETLRVWRDIEGRVRCSCAEFVEADDPRFRCQHILAVKYYLEPPIEETAPSDAPAEIEAPIFIDATPELAPVPSELEVVPANASSDTKPGSFEDVLDFLKRPLPEEVVKQRVGWTDRRGREHEVDYVEWHVVADILDAAAPRWSHAVRNITQIGGLVAVTASITIDGVTREGIGTGEAIDEKGTT